MTWKDDIFIYTIDCMVLIAWISFIPYKNLRFLWIHIVLKVKSPRFILISIIGYSSVCNFPIFIHVLSANIYHKHYVKQYRITFIQIGHCSSVVGCSLRNREVISEKPMILILNVGRLQKEQSLSMFDFEVCCGHATGGTQTHNFPVKSKTSTGTTCNCYGI